MLKPACGSYAPRCSRLERAVYHARKLVGQREPWRDRDPEALLDDAEDRDHLGEPVADARPRPGALEERLDVPMGSLLHHDERQAVERGRRRHAAGGQRVGRGQNGHVFVLRQRDEAHLYPALDQPLHHHLEGVSVPLTVYRLLGLREPRPEYPDDPGAERSVLSA